MKVTPHSINEIHSLKGHVDKGIVTVTYKQNVDPVTAFRDTHHIKLAVEKAHLDPKNLEPNEHGNVVAQVFEEGWVALMVDAAKHFSATEYYMDFYDLGIFPACSRMHIHTGERMVTIKTGPDTRLVISSLSPMEKCDREGRLGEAEDLVPGEDNVRRYNLVVPPNSIVEVQIPPGVSHQFNAFGPHAVITSKHIEDVIEVKREGIDQLDMLKQTIFLQERRVLAAICFAGQRFDNPSLTKMSMLYRILLAQNAEGYLSSVQVSDLYSQDKMHIPPLTASGIIDDLSAANSEAVRFANVPSKVKEWCKGNEAAEKIIAEIEKSPPVFIKKLALLSGAVKGLFDRQAKRQGYASGYGL